MSQEAADRYISVNHHLQAMQTWLSDPSVNEICVNEPDRVHLWQRGIWHEVDAPIIDFDWLHALGQFLANISQKPFNESNPILSAYLPNGERVEMTRPPVTAKHVINLNIRKHTSSPFDLADFVEQGYFTHTNHTYSHTLSEQERENIKKQLMPEQVELWNLARSNDWAKFLQLAITEKQNLLLSGATGSGKTSFIRALIEKIPTYERLITVEDTPEMPLPNHPNSNALFYRRDNGSNANFKVTGATAKEVLASCMRKTPNRVILAEMRGDESFYFLQNVLNSGHPGGMSTVHANSTKEAFVRVSMLLKASPEGLSMGLSEIMRLLHTLIHVVVQLVFDRERGRHVPAIFYDPMYAFSLVG